MYLMELTTMWNESIERWAVSLRAAGRVETTIGTRREHMRWCAAAVPVGPWEVTTDHLIEWTGSKTWARETRRGVRASLRSFYGWGVTSGHVGASPALGLAPVRAAEPRPRPASQVALDAAMRTAGPRERLMLRLAAEAGLRRAEVAQVHASDVIEDLAGWSLVVHGKGSRERMVPLSPGLALALRTQIHAAGGGYAFPGQDGGHLSPRWVGKIVTTLLPGDVTMHALRHRFATRAYGVDRDLLTVQQLLGHASPVTTRVYVQVPDDALRRTVLAVA